MIDQPNKIRIMLNNGEAIEHCIKVLRENGYNKIESIKLLRIISGKSLAEIKRIVHFSPVWEDTKILDEQLHDALIDGFLSDKDA